MIAPASLKHVDFGSYRRFVRRPLRGMIAPASLKRNSGGRQRSRLWPTPGHDCPGLIEAVISAAQWPDMALPTPGHDCPGLIEALPARSGSCARSFATPGHDCPGLIEAKTITEIIRPSESCHSGA